MNLSKDIISKFTDHAKNVLDSIEKEGKGSGLGKSTSLDWVEMIFKEEGSLGSHILKNFKITSEALEKFKMEYVESGKLEKGDFLAMGPIILKSALAARNQKSAYIGTEHLLLAVIETRNKIFEEFLVSIKVNYDQFRQSAKFILDSEKKFPDAAKVISFLAGQQKEDPSAGANMSSLLAAEAKNAEAGSVSALEYFCTDLTDLAAKRKIGPVIGRDKELARVINILSRKIKNNPILIGEPGVGKTAIVEALAIRVSEGRVPATLRDKKIFMLDLGSLVAGSMFRGEFEARLKDILREIEEKKDIILFIDEIHTIVGAGGTTGGLDAANILKPALSNRALQAIGATTLAEFRKYFAKDAALERRFQSVQVAEPSAQDAVKILEGLKKSYESFHHIVITKEAIKAAVSLSARLMPDRYLPDKAIDLIDEAASHLANSDSDTQSWQKIKELMNKKSEVSSGKEKAVEDEKYESAVTLKKEEESIGEKIKELEALNRKNSSAGKKSKVLDAAHIYAIAAEITGVPEGEVSEEESGKIKDLEKRLAAKIIGQDEAIGSLARVIKRHRANIANPARPIGSFIFLGPTGVGKTELVKQLAEIMFGGKKNLIKIDMSEFMERHNVSRLVGAPPGYVGFEEGGKLTDAVRLKPYSVVLFDEIEKAHPEAMNILLQILEDGTLTDTQGRKVDFKNTIIIMTSNLGSEEFTASAIGFLASGADKTKLQNEYAAIKNKALGALKERFRPEFINRIDEAIVFHALELSDLEKITALQLKEFGKRLAENKIKIGPAVVREIARKSLNAAFGARMIRKNIRDAVEDPVAEKIIAGEIKKGNKIAVEMGKDGKMEIKVTK